MILTSFTHFGKSWFHMTIWPISLHVFICFCVIRPKPQIVRFGDISLASSSGSWSRLKNLLQDADDTDAPAAAEKTPGSERLPHKRVQHIRRAKLKDRSMIKDYYSPGKRIRSFPTVVEKEDPKTLKCDVCGYLISTNWYFQHPKTGEMAVLVPNNGHALCRRVHKNCKFLVVDGSPYKFDCPNNIDYCIHQVLRHVCAPCGGLNVCSHGKPRWNCPSCKHMIRKRGREPSAAGDMSQGSIAKEKQSTAAAVSLSGIQRAGQKHETGINQSC